MIYNKTINGLKVDVYKRQHLGMSGSLRILPEELPPEKHDHVELVMSNGKVLRYTDPRRFGAWLWTKELEGHNVLAHLGPVSYTHLSR